MKQRFDRKRQQPCYLYWFIGGGCDACYQEFISAFYLKYAQQASSCIFTQDPQQADIIIACGLVSQEDISVLQELRSAMRKQVSIIAVGSCVISGGVFADAHMVVQVIGQVLPVDMYVVGCPPLPGAMMSAIEQCLQQKEKSEAIK